MIKRSIATLLMSLAAAAFAVPTDINLASRAELESIRGVGPALAEALLDERKKRPFRDWDDLIGRVKGIGAASAARLSAAGLTVGGSAFRQSAPAPAN